MLKPSTFRVVTLGCKVNQYESELLREQLIDCGVREAAHDENPDLCIVNTCTVTGQSDAKCRKLIRHLSKNNPSVRIFVTGCYAERDSESLRKLKNVEAVIDNSGKERLVRSILGESCDSREQREGISSFEEHTRAFIKIQNGCNQFCTYCIIPYVRGEPRSREIPGIVEEARTLIENGYREIVLTGIHVGMFGRTRSELHELISALEKIDGLRRLRISSIDPNEVNDRLISAIADSPVACNHLHVSLQSGSDRILELMNRNYTRGRFLDLAKTLYDRIPGMSISTDIMVGFPGETQEDFEESCRMVKEVGFSKVHIFPFSPREGTKAWSMPGRVSPEVSHDRARILSDTSRKAAIRHREKFVGRTMRILVERGASGRNRYEGFTTNYLRTIASHGGSLSLNSFVDVSIERCDDKYLFGRTLEED